MRARVRLQYRACLFVATAAARARNQRLAVGCLESEAGSRAPVPLDARCTATMARADALQLALAHAVEVGVAHDHAAIARAVSLLARARREVEARAEAATRLQMDDAAFSALFDEPRARLEPLPSDPTERRWAETGLAALAACKWDEAAGAFEQSGADWPLAQPLFALACASLVDGPDVGEVERLLSKEPACRAHPVLLLALARLASGRALQAPDAPTPKGALSCLFLASLSEPVLAKMPAEAAAVAQDGAERERDAQPWLGAPLPPPPKAGPPRELSAEERWRANPDAKGVAYPALEELLKLRGQKEVKELAVGLATRKLAGSHLRPDQRVTTSLNFVLVGNPGTGKTTVARLLGRLLIELRMRTRGAIKETTGAEMAREGADEVTRTLASALHGVLLVDEAAALEVIVYIYIYIYICIYIYIYIYI